MIEEAAQGYQPRKVRSETYRFVACVAGLVVIVAAIFATGKFLSRNNVIEETTPNNVVIDQTDDDVVTEIVMTGFELGRYIEYNRSGFTYIPMTTSSIVQVMPDDAFCIDTVSVYVDNVGLVEAEVYASYTSTEAFFWKWDKENSEKYYGSQWDNIWKIARDDMIYCACAY